ncbi:MAG: tRNA uridine-5-carboxymethylaminomethyl(34) synthesis GTPase MnmE, partial [Flavobacteriales bacterium]|nr:tRNA uridine-5-carboxymethylaminomethyl(34) synthesis GTPase MnmE [Flavobacteriales bacterium]
EDVAQQLAALREKTGEGAVVIYAANKSDKASDPAALTAKWKGTPSLLLSAAEGTGLDALREKLLEVTKSLVPSEGDTVVSNLRHYEALSKAREALYAVRSGLDTGITGDFLAVDIRKSLHHLGEITGEITTDDLLGNIFSRFCIGK